MLHCIPLYSLDIACFSEVDLKTRGSMGRMLGIWKERNIFDAEFVNKLKKCFGTCPVILVHTAITKSVWL